MKASPAKATMKHNRNVNVTIRNVAMSMSNYLFWHCLDEKTVSSTIPQVQEWLTGFESLQYEEVV